MFPRHREIRWENENKWCTLLEVVGDKIITGWDKGQIKIYNKADLRCETVLPSTDGGGKVYCLQYSPAGLIAGYSDGNICFWNVDNKLLVETFSIFTTEESKNDYENAHCMRWRGEKLVVGTNEGRVLIWACNEADLSFNLECEWNSKIPNIERIDLYENTLILLPASHLRLGFLYMYSLSGRRLRTISSSPGNLYAMVLQGGHVIAGGNEKVLQVWKIDTGTIVKELEGHEDYITAVDVHDSLIVSGDRGGDIIIWSIKAALEGKPEKICTLADEYFEGIPRWGLKLGSNFLVRHCPESSKIVVMDFPNPPPEADNNRQ